MPSFLGIWLPLCLCTWSVVLYRDLDSNGHATRPIIALSAIQIASLVAWALYRVVLYPKYWTPFRHLPTPAVRSFWYGNRKQFFPDHAWIDVRDAFETVPSNGLLRFYEPLNKEVLVATTTEVVKEMFSLKPNDFGHPKNVQYMINQLTGSQFNFLSPHGHRIFRKNLRPAFTTGHIQKTLPLVWSKASKMIRLLEHELRGSSSPRPVVNLRDYIRRTMWDASGLITLGHDFETLEKPTEGTKERLAGVLGRLGGSTIKWGYFVINYVDVRPLLAAFSPLLMRSSAGKALEQMRGTIRLVVKRKVCRHQAAASKSGAPDQFDLDITSVSIASGVFPTEELVDNGMLFLTAGPNSTGTAVEWAIYELSRNPGMQDRLRREINASPGSMGSDPGDESVSLAQPLPYLAAVCNEVIRFYPFVPLSPRVAQRDTTLLGEHIPKDTIILTAVEAFNRDKSLWGDDADVFNPDRWLGDGEGSGGAANSHAMLSFGAGPGACIGQNYARAMMSCLVAALVKRFEVELVNTHTAGRLKAAPFKRSEEGMLVRLKVLAD